MKYEDITPGSLLIAPPHMTDIRFAGSVLLVCQLAEDSSTVALCLNSDTEFTVNDLRDEINIDANLPFPLYWGGPVQPGSIWMLHDADWVMDKTIVINENWAMTSSRGMFHHIAAGDIPRQFRFMHGFSSWSPNQLKRELEGQPPWHSGSSWLITEDPGVDYIYEMPEGVMWEACMQRATEQAIDAWF